MRTIFLINPVAGQGKDLDVLETDILRAGVKNNIPVEIYETKSAGDAERYVKERAEENPKEEFRFIACGGDGTFNEVLNGVIGHANSSCSVIPIGTGNDFVRNFPDAGDFTDIDAILRGNPVRCDAIRFTGVLDGREQTRYCGNMFNIGFDCNVVDLTADMKKKPLLSGSAAYLASVAVILIRKKGADLRIEADGELVSDGPILLTSIANGSYCGGGVKSNPYASVQDGRIDLSVIRNMSRIRFISLFPKYSKGIHLELPGIERWLTNRKAHRVTVTPNHGLMRLCTDGEITNAEKIEFEVIHEAFTLIAPLKRKDHNLYKD